MNDYSTNSTMVAKKAAMMDRRQRAGICLQLIQYMLQGDSAARWEQRDSGATLCDRALETVDDYVASGQIDHQSAKQLLDECLDLIPDSDNVASIHSDSHLKAAIASALGACLYDSPDWIANVSYYAFAIVLSRFVLDKSGKSYDEQLQIYPPFVEAGLLHEALFG